MILSQANSSCLDTNTGGEWVRLPEKLLVWVLGGDAEDVWCLLSSCEVSCLQPLKAGESHRDPFARLSSSEQIEAETPEESFGIEPCSIPALLSCSSSLVGSTWKSRENSVSNKIMGSSDSCFMEFIEAISSVVFCHKLLFCINHLVYNFYRLTPSVCSSCCWLARQKKVSSI